MAKKFILSGLAILIFFAGTGLLAMPEKLKNETFTLYSKPEVYFWDFRSVDTMKYSRDLSREKLGDAGFDEVIDKQMKDISNIGATHAAIATPYDEEFLPVLKRWVSAARKHGLKVWFRGNWSGWEQWFGYPKITRSAHIQKTQNFIFKNPDLFENGDVFSGCPECENGGPGDPRATGDVDGYRKFLAEEYLAIQSAFKKIDKQVSSNYFSMNADVARLVMDKETTMALGGIVTIDHYVDASEKLMKDVEDIAAESGGKIILGEFGAPIPDIHGEMSEEEQARWVGDSLNVLLKAKSLIGINYWVNVGGSTQIWDSEGNPLPVAQALERFYKPYAAYGAVYDELNNPIAGAKIVYSDAVYFSGPDGYFALPFAPQSGLRLKIFASDFQDQEISLKPENGQLEIIMVKKRKNLKFKILEFFKKRLGSEESAV